MSAEVMELPSNIRSETSVHCEEPASLDRVICYRDPADVRTIRRQSRLIILAFLLQRSPLLALFTNRFSDPIALWSICRQVAPS